MTEVTAGSGFYAPTLFDNYSRFDLTPAAGYALPIVRKPAPEMATALGGGYLASGAGDAARLPSPWLPPGLKLDPEEGAGEVQTPLLGEPAAGLEVGDRVYMRHAKAGELCERFDTLHLVEGDAIVDEVPTYRGEGMSLPLDAPRTAQGPRTRLGVLVGEDAVRVERRRARAWNSPSAGSGAPGSPPSGSGACPSGGGRRSRS